MESKARDVELKIEKSKTKQEALNTAIAATELYMKALRQASSEADKARISRKCNQLIVKAEEIKKASAWPPQNSDAFSRVPVSERRLNYTDSYFHRGRLSLMIPYSSLSLKMHLRLDSPSLKLSDAQLETFAGWKRPREREDVLSQIPGDIESDEIFMIATKNIDLVQDITTDCSVVASLCAGTARASKGHSKVRLGPYVLATIIRPYDNVLSRPRASANGKYILRLQFNGCYRKVTIDDRLPASSSSRSLHVVDRNNPGLLWPALVEKAYLKVRGGYDFPGSNSGTDLWVLTGWIPEQIFLQSDELQSESLWKRIHKSFEFGDVLITLGTGKMTRREEYDLGLAGEHDYAILDMRESASQRLLLVKNPWCDGMAWKGSRRRPTDEEPITGSWTEDLRGSLNDPDIVNRPPGTFWMVFEDVVQNFESLYLNWNPGLFRHRQDHHLSWTIPVVNTMGTLDQNPQYVVQSNRSENVWVLLSRHFTTEEHDIAQRSSTSSSTSSALGFIALYVFDADGRRVYVSDGALHRGAYVDSPQTLARFEMSPNKPYTVVTAQQGLALPRYTFTFSFFSRSPLAVQPAQDSLIHCTSHGGAWTSRTAGGNAGAASYPSNPQFSISVSTTTDMALVLEADREDLAVHVTMIWAGGERVTVVNARDIVGASGDYRRGCALAELQNVAAGKYTIVCSTFEAGETGNFVLRVRSSARCEIRPVLAETAGRLVNRLPNLIFPDGVDRMLAPVAISRLTRVRIVAKAGNAMRWPTPPKTRPSLKLCLERGQGPNKVVLVSSGDGDFSDAPAGIRTADIDLSPEMTRLGGIWIVVERLGGRIGYDEVLVEVLTDSQVDVGAWGTGDG
ncbi:PALB protein [Rutstroemia sp. NJR-2017a BBW]|nr:PALB protein [Rutstroemia sp. NJR-2017a BBW]